MSDKIDIPRLPLDIKYTLKNLIGRVFVLLEWGKTLSGNPEVVGVYNSKEALVLGFSKYIEDVVPEDTESLAVAYLSKEGYCCVKDFHFIIWETNIQEIVKNNDEEVEDD